MKQWPLIQVQQVEGNLNVPYTVCLMTTILFLCLICDMSFAKTFFRNFLRISRIESESLKSSNEICVVLGNEAGDADSIISAICYAYYHQSKYNVSSYPVACIRRKDLILRQDVSLLLRSIDIDLQDINCLEDLFIPEFSDRRLPTKFCLVDHNVLSSKLSYFGEYVSEVIDHHFDMGEYPWIDQTLRNIAFDNAKNMPETGSTCTLIAEKLRESDVLTDKSRDAEDIATLLLTVIDLDTLYMHPDYGKGTARDQSMIDYLQSMFPSIDRLNNFNLVKGAKVDPTFWKSLSVADALNYDLKTIASRENGNLGCINYCGISSVLICVDDLLDRVDFVSTVAEMLSPTYNAVAGNNYRDNNRAVDGDHLHIREGVSSSLVIVMSAHSDCNGRFRRELLLCSDSLNTLTSLTKFLLKFKDESLGLVVSEDIKTYEHSFPPASSASPAPLENVSSHSNPFVFYCMKIDQANTKVSRKQLLPAVSDFVRSFENVDVGSS